MTFGLFLVGIWALYRIRKVYVRYAALFLGTALLAFMHGRGLLIFLYVGIIAVAPAFKWNKRSVAVERFRHYRLVLALFFLLFALVVIRRDTTVEKEGYQKAIDYVVGREDAKKMAVFTGYIEGGYAEWMGLTPYIDPRAEVYLKRMNQKEDILYEFFDVYYGKADTNAFLEKYKFRYVVLKEDVPMQYDMGYAKHYEEVYGDDGYTVYKRAG